MTTICHHMSTGDVFTPPRSEHVLCEVAYREHQALAYTVGDVKTRSKGCYKEEVKLGRDTQRFKRRKLQHIRVPSVSALEKSKKRSSAAISVKLMEMAAKGVPLRKSKPRAMRLVRFP